MKTTNTVQSNKNQRGEMASNKRQNTLENSQEQYSNG